MPLLQELAASATCARRACTYLHVRLVLLVLRLPAVPRTCRLRLSESEYIAERNENRLMKVAAIMLAITKRMLTGLHMSCC